MGYHFFTFVSGRILLMGSFFGLVACVICFAQLERRLGASILDVLPGYSLIEVKDSLSVYGAEGRKIYAWCVLTLDLLFPVCYLIFCSGLIVVLTAPGRTQWLSLFPVFLALIDFLENLQIFNILISPSSITQTQVHLASTTTQVKHAMTGILLVFFVVLVLYNIGLKIQSKRM
jgi:hypothetical protein